MKWPVCYCSSKSTGRLPYCEENRTINKGDKGVYLFRFRLPSEETIIVGKLGLIKFPAGYYIYAGSARGGLESRIRRHLEGPGKLRWHVDYLSSKSIEKKAAVVLTGQREECDLNRAVAAIPGARMAVRGFGSSDCRCQTHLYRLERPVWPDYPGLFEPVLFFQPD